jgi:NADPH:quinone reductase-like Zn-dependent oxidoreductase
VGAGYHAPVKAVLQSRYGDPDAVLAISDIPVPPLGDDDVLVHVRATSVHPDVWHVVTGKPYVLRLMGGGLGRPKQAVPGIDVAGVVEAVGRGVTRFRPGDAVFGESHAGIQWINGGAFAEYAAVPQGTLALKPDNVTFEQAAAVAASGYIALTNLGEAAPIQPGQRVLVNGAGGGVGGIALQLAKASGARVTGVDRAGKLDMIRTLGADETIDCRQADLTKRAERYDVIVDVASNLTIAEGKRMLTPNGSHIFIGHDHFGQAAGPVLGSVPRALAHLVRGLFARPSRERSPRPGKQEVMTTLADLMSAGKLTPVIDSAFELERVHDAMRHLKSGNACGRIVLTPWRGEPNVR